MKDTRENHYKFLLAGAEDWAIEMVEEDIAALEKENAELRRQIALTMQPSRPVGSNTYTTINEENGARHFLL